MRSKDTLATIVVDLGYGDSGKGNVTDFFCSLDDEAIVVRFNGGSQAAHRVVMPDGRSHVFSQFGAGMFRPGVRTLLSKHMLVSPLAMLSEEALLRTKGVTDAFARTELSEEALVITPFQRAANRLRELARGDGRHGSVGHGVGETASDAVRFPRDALRIRHLREVGLARFLRRIQERKRGELSEALASCRDLPAAREEIAFLEDPGMPERWIASIQPFLAQARIRSEEDLRARLLRQRHVFFEGAQGVLLDEWRGFHPYTTWSTCTFDNALGLLKDYGWQGGILKTGVIRGYGTRHGAGPFPTEDAEMARLLPDTDNVTNDWQKDFRVGWLDLVALRYAIKACGGIDALVVTCLDRLAPFKTWMACDAYETPAGTVSDLPLGPFTDLAHQERLTGILMQARPKFVVTTETADLAWKCREHAFTVNFLLDGAIRLLISTGPTCQDKAVLF